MRALLVSGLHPDVKHISGVRAARLADGLARSGHRVILLTPTLRTGDAPTPLPHIPEAVADHDWTRPLNVTVPQSKSVTMSLWRSPRLPDPLRRAGTAFVLVAGQGTRGEFAKGARAYRAPIAKAFMPDVAWGTFGDASTLLVAQAMARAASAPWVMDIKDNWEAFVPAALRGSVAARFRDAAAMTCNAGFHCAIAERWHGRRGDVIYSGVGQEMIAAEAPPMDRTAFRITITGGTYVRPFLAGLIGGIQAWLGRLPEATRANVEVAYAGNSQDMVREVAAEVGLACHLVVHPYLTLPELAHLCQGAAVNCYVWSRETFHHKLLELLACRRPVISYPGEAQESIELARGVGGRLLPCPAAEPLGQALDEIWDGWLSGTSATANVDTRMFSWEAAAAKLEGVMAAVIAKRSQSPAAGRAAAQRELGNRLRM